MNLLGVILTAGASLAVVLGFLGTWWVKAGGPRWRAAKTFVARWVETVNGRPAEEDAYGRETAPAIPPLAEQQAATQKQLGELTTAVRTLVEHGQQLEQVRTDVVELQRRVTRLESHTLERIASHVAQAKTFDAIAEAQRRSSAVDAEEPDTEL